MAENEQKDNSSSNSYIKFTGMAFQMIAIIGVFTFAGFKIDEATLHTTKWVTAVLALLGVFIALYTVIKSLNN
jgi:F0F1-type ATP synthase assembly protein I